MEDNKISIYLSSIFIWQSSPVYNLEGLLMTVHYPKLCKITHIFLLFITASKVSKIYILFISIDQKRVESKHTVRIGPRRVDNINIMFPFYPLQRSNAIGWLG